MNSQKIKNPCSPKKPSYGPNQIIAGKYRYLRVLGAGGMGEVHLVCDIQTGQQLAMKCCLEERYEKRFEREVLSWLRLGKHPNVVSAIYFDRVDNLPSLFIEYVDGTSLKDVIERSVRQKTEIPLETVFDYAIQISWGMAHLHKSGIIHRDLKPSNILIATEAGGHGEIKITDMGLSKMKGMLDVESPPSEEPAKEITYVHGDADLFSSPDLTRTHEMLGTPEYMSPQQYAYSKGVGEETDIYSFGLILYEMLTQGKKPFEASNYQAWVYAHTHATPKHVKTQVSSRLPLFRRKSGNIFYDLVMQCLAKKISDRPQSFVEITEKLEELYQKIFSKGYATTRRCKSTRVSEKDINNQAVSLLEMGESYAEEGLKKLEKLCSASPECLEARLNQLLFHLKSGQLSLSLFWKEVRRLTCDPHESHKIVEILVGSSLERGSFQSACFKLLDSFDEIARFPSLLRLKAKWLFLRGEYAKSMELFKALCQTESYLWEDFYHHAGAIVQRGLEKEEIKLNSKKNRFSLALPRQTKQEVWYVLKEAEAKCGTSSKLEKARDLVVGGEEEKKSFWYEKFSLSGHQGAVHGVALSSDRYRAVSGGEDGTLRLWSLTQQKEIFSLSDHGAPVTAISLSLDGKYGISGDKARQVLVWDLHEKKALCRLKKHDSPITSVALAGDAGVAASSDEEGAIKIWDMKGICQEKKFWRFFTKKQVSALAPSHGKVNTLALGFDSRHLMAGCEDGSVLLWEMNRLDKEARVLEGHKSPIRKICISADNKLAVSASVEYPENLFLWDLHEKKKLISFSGMKKEISDLAIASNARFILIASEEGIIIWDLQQKERIASLEGHECAIRSIAATPDARMAISGGEDGSLKVWENNFVWPLFAEQGYLKVVPGK